MTCISVSCVIHVNSICDKRHEYFKYGKNFRSNQKNNFKNKTQTKLPHNIELVMFHVNTSPNYDNKYGETQNKTMSLYAFFSRFNGYSVIFSTRFSFIISFIYLLRKKSMGKVQ